MLKDSSRPWGFIPPEAIHDVIALNATERRDANVSIEASNDVNGPTPRVGMTFRRLENLRVWVASLKLRYEVGCFD